MYAGGSGSFTIRGYAGCFQNLFCYEGCFDHFVERSVFCGVEVDDTPVRIIRRLNAAAPRIYFDTAEGDHVQEAGFVGTDEEFLVFFILCAMIGEGCDPVGNFSEDVLLIKAGACNAVGVSVQGLRSVV